MTIQGATRNLDDVSQDLIDCLIQEIDKRIPKSYSFFTEFMMSDIGLTMSEVVKWRPTQNRDVFEALLAANQFICSNIPRFLCMANDPDFSSTVEYSEFADKYACPSLLRHIARFVDQITGHQLKGARKQLTLKFDRLQLKKSLFEQLFTHTELNSTWIFSSGKPEPFLTKFKNEGAIDQGGPFRDFMDNVSNEIMQTYFEPTTNMQLRPDEVGYVPRSCLTDS